MNTLIIRSASMERLDDLMEAIKGEGGNLHLLTHPHMAEQAKRFYPELTVIPYPYDGGFNKEDVAGLIGENGLREEYDRTIVLCSNLSGKGHENVVEAAWFFSQKVAIFNVNGDLLPANPVYAAEERLERFLFYLPVWLLTAPAWFIAGVALATAASLKLIGLTGKRD